MQPRSAFFVPLGLISALIAGGMFASSTSSAFAIFAESSSSSFSTSSSSDSTSSFSDSTSSFFDSTSSDSTSSFSDSTSSSFSSESSSSSSFSLCGNGEVNEGEQCDDENSSSGDGCSDTCQIEPGYECHLYDEDDGDIEENYSVCSRLCGNGEVDQGEQCDDGNENNSDSCTNSCTVPESSSSSSGDEPQGNGSHRGDRTQDAANEVGYLANYYGFGKTPPPSYGGGEEPPLTPSELSFICSVQRTFRTFTLDIAQSIAVDIAKFLGRDTTVLVQMLLDAHTCDGVDSNQGEMSMNLKPFYVDAQGIPVTGDIVLDACLRGGASLKQIRSNIDAMFYRRADVWVPLSCADYHTGDTWHDTKGNYFGFDGPGSRVTPPEGYAVLPLLNVAER